jgi:pyrimidine operon attenuation protein/uracil phosphoribosyltransferase
MPTLPNAEQLLDQLVERLRPRAGPETGMIGIVTGGAWVAERLHQALGLAQPLGLMDISFYRDDYSSAGLKASVKPSRIPFDVEGRDILLVDDVLYTGRTTRAALNELFDYGRPRSVTLIVLADRDERQLPIAAQFVGATVAVPRGMSLELRRDEAGRLALALEPRIDAGNAPSAPSHSSSGPAA